MALMAPFFEEIFYRWYLFHGLKYLFRHFKSGNWIAIVLCSAIFAVGHFGYADPIWIKGITNIHHWIYSLSLFSGAWN